MLDVKHVLVFLTVGSSLFFSEIPVQIEQVNFVKRVQQTFPHPLEGEVIKVAVVGNATEHAITCPFNMPLRESEKFDVVVVEHLRVSLIERLPIDLEVVRCCNVATVGAAQQVMNPIAFVCGVDSVRRVAEDYHQLIQLFNLDGGIAFLRDGVLFREIELQVTFIQRIGEINVQPFVFRKVVTHSGEVLR